MNENELMGQMKISKAVAKMAVPSVISSLVTVVYNMADTFFVGQTGDPLQVAAVSLTNPIFILMMAFANMFGMGGSAVLSMALGAKNEKRARQTSSFVTYASLIVSQKGIPSTFPMVRRSSSGQRLPALLSGRKDPVRRR